ncbi:hypothetical protein SAMD00019534_004010 [Acytostelium subglobosum LB1]|uniref:hypothetical protein n=1 Tax=Acytostelium subglobosum LB1 TaxID=1410327 RepID=UPI000644D6D0|nr:hypothetical protein SAMD00019534_004010 [Acytostelium subglobosum LB1]GAM17226.1 hypothetical protein SAMD00019534_004010 [Acytostelium subglobosum LB1]|eukprot:XP_012759288.1 hypothetical protein SAMD00019534_004010 [Acytostelium subglobosum LB1]
MVLGDVVSNRPVLSFWYPVVGVVEDIPLIKDVIFGARTTSLAHMYATPLEDEWRVTFSLRDQVQEITEEEDEVDLEWLAAKAQIMSNIRAAQLGELEDDEEV